MMADLIQHPKKGAFRSIGAICALGALGAFGAPCAEWCKSLLNIYKDRARARENRPENGLTDPFSGDFFEFINDFENSGLIKDEEKQELIKIGAVGAFWSRFGALSVRFGALSKRMENITDVVREYVEEVSGTFTNSQIYGDLVVQTAPDKKRVRSELSRLAKKGIIERGAKNGQYRKIDNDLNEMDFLNAQDEQCNIFMPFGLHKIVKIMPGNIIVIAGQSNAGKTAFLMNIIRDNMREWGVHYFNSEMGSSELRLRLKLFDHPIDSWEFKAYERSDNFHDVIRTGPGMLNIIDFIEIHDEFWKIGGMIREIHKRLDGAVAIIAIQKNKGETLGRGGAMSIEKARLYLSLSPGTCKIAKAKNFIKPDFNPNGRSYDFKLVNGCNFVQVRDWHYKVKK